ncbi:uncharacterized protein B0H64DRAFT_472587 [Chaetomium fimeti]|uniref:NAD-dependent epimerase/dehydratase domain-containing protein n=1 Tax=Chaetomium fimeti TaxID=1854472 RepID=A0AAE0HNI8_9PEZI|nr:hypothetical protein B0H64DRAFT_472587 [Chaetomium fimeti]
MGRTGSNGSSKYQCQVLKKKVQDICEDESAGAVPFLFEPLALHLLKEGYRVRAVVRSHFKERDLQRRPTIQATNPGPRLSFAIVPSIMVDGAYDSAMEGVTNVIHCASPVATGAKVVYANDDGTFFIRPAVEGTLNILRAAAKVPTVARVVVTSSLAALIPFQDLSRPGGAPGGARAYTPLDRAPLEPAPYRSDVAAYVASKISALQAADAWVTANAPHFDLVHLHPGFVLGPHHTATTLPRALQGGNTLVMAALRAAGLRRRRPRGSTHAAVSVHVDDLAKVHVRALHQGTVPGGCGYIVARPAAWEDVPRIACARFPDVFGVSPPAGPAGPIGNVTAKGLNIDDEGTQDAFPRIQFAGFEEQVVSVIQQYLDLADEADMAALREMARRIER